MLDSSSHMYVGRPSRGAPAVWVLQGFPSAGVGESRPIFSSSVSARSSVSSRVAWSFVRSHQG